MTGPVDLATVLSRIDRPWQPRTVAVLNDYDVRVVKTHGEFTRHRHPTPTRSSSSCPAP